MSQLGQDVLVCSAILLAPGHLHMAELWQHPKRLNLPRQLAREQIDSAWVAVSEESRGLREVIYPFRNEAHQPGAGEIRRHGIIGQNDLVQVSMGSVQRAVAFHGNDSIGNHEVRPNCRADVENASLDALPMENVFWPPVDGARNYAKHVLHRQRDPGPMVGFHLRHGHKEIRIQYSPRQPERFHRRIAASGADLDNLVAIQVDKLDFPVSQMVAEPAFGKHQLRVALMSGAFADHNTSCAEAEKGFGRCPDQPRIRIDLDTSDVLDQVRLEQHRFAFYIERK